MVDTTVLNDLDLTTEHQTPTNNDLVNDVANVTTPKSETEQNNPESTNEDAVIDDLKIDVKEDVEDLPMSSKELSKFVVGLVNLGLSAGMPKIYLNAEFNEEERSIIDAIQNNEQSEDNEVNAKIMRRYLAYIKGLQNVPLTPDEVKMYEKNWQKCFDKWAFKMSPEMALITSSLIIVGGRFLPVIAKKFEKI